MAAVALLAACNGHNSNAIPAPWPSNSPGTPTNPPSTPAVTDAQFVQQAAMSGTEEVLQAQTELNASTSDNTTKTFAQQMINDHTTNNQQLMQVATSAGFASQAQAGVASAPSPSPLAPSAYFQGQVTSHQQAIALFQSEAANGQNQSLVQFAQQTIPILQMHLQMAQQGASNP